MRWPLCLSRWVALCLRAWRWYWSELAILAGPMTRAWLVGHRLLVRLGPDGAPLIPANAQTAELVLEIPASEVLSRSMTLPVTARRHLTAILMNDLDRLSPLRPDIVYASCHLVGHDRARGEIMAELRLIRREWLDGALSACAQAGALPTRLCFEDNRTARHGCLPLLRQPPLTQRLIRVAFIALLCALPLELAAAAFVKTERQKAELELVLAESVKARAEAQSVERSRAAATTLRASFEGLIREAGSNRPSRLIAVLSEVVPTDSWAFTLRIEGGQIWLSGFSQSATALLSAIEDSPTFRNAQFRAPVVRTQGGQERFEMTFETEGVP